MKKLLSLLLILPLLTLTVLVTRGADTPEQFGVVKAPWQMESWNIFHNNPKSLKELSDLYLPMIILADSPKSFYQHPCASEILLVIHRLSQLSQENQARHLPFFPNDNVMTYDLATSLLFPAEGSAFAFAQREGLVPADARSGSYMSRQQFIDLLLGVFTFPEGTDPMATLKQAGIVKYPELWQETTRQGFPVTHGMRLMKSMVNAVESTQLSAHHNALDQMKVSLPQEALKLEDKSLKVLFAALLLESAEFSTAQTVSFEKLQSAFQADFGSPLTSILARRIRSAYYQDKAPAATTLPEQLPLGECHVALPQKLSLLAYTESHRNGSQVSCDVPYGKAMLNLPPGAVLINGTLPDVSFLMNKDMPEKKLVQFNFTQSLENTLIFAEDGEKKAMISFRAQPGVLNQHNYAGVYLQDSRGKSLGTAYDLVDKNTTTLAIPLRALDTVVKGYVFDEPHYKRQ